MQNNFNQKLKDGCMTTKFYYGYRGDYVTVYSAERKESYYGGSFNITKYFTKNDETKEIEWHGEKFERNSLLSGWQVVEQDFIIKHMIPWRW